MNRKTELLFKILGLTLSTTIGIVGLVMESKRKTKLSDEDKNDIAELVNQKNIENNKKLVNSLYGEPKVES